jgi:hypothetical protein
MCSRSVLLLLLTISASIAANAAAFVCTSEVASVPSLRSEGTTELIGDILVSCSGGTPTASGARVPTANITIFLNTGVTSRVLSGQSGLSAEALLFIDDPNSGQPNTSTTFLACGSTSGCPITGTGTGMGTFSGANGRYNVFESVISGNEVQFFGVPIDPPGASATRIFRIKGIRVNASALVPSAAPNVTVSASISVSGTALPLTGATLTAGTVTDGLNFRLRDGSNSTSLSGGVVTAGSGQSPSGIPAAVFRFSELLPNAFKPRTTAPFTTTEVSPAPATQNNPDQRYASESGMIFSVPSITVSPADSGTRLKAEIGNVPMGVSVWVGVVNNGAIATKSARLVQNEIGVFTPVPGGAVVSSGSNIVSGSLTSVAQVPVANGRAVAIWEVLADNPTALEDFDFPVWFTGAGPVSLDAIVGNLAPNPTNGAFTQNAASQASSTLPIPRFTDPLSAAPSRVISQMVDGGGWKTTITLVNTDSISADFTLRFWNEQGVAQSLPFVHDGLQSAMTGTIPGGGSRTIETDGLSTSLTVAWAEVISSISIGGFAIFRQSVDGRPDQEAAVPLASSSRDIIFPFDNTSGSVTSMALVNPDSTTAAGGMASFRGEDGTAISQVPFNLSALSHAAFELPEASTAIANRRGVAEFLPASEMSAIGLRFIPGGAFTSFPVPSPLDPTFNAPNRNLSQIADGGGWKTTFILTNMDTSPAGFTLNFWRDDGTPFPLEFDNIIGGASASFEGTIPVGGSLTLASVGTAGAVSQGWAQLIATKRIGGLAVFRQSVPGRPDQEAAVPIAASVANFVLPFDNAQNFVTSMALVNTNAANSIAVSVVIQDEVGNQIGTDSLMIGPNGHTAFALPSRFPATANLRGTVVFSTAGADLSGLGLRFNPGGAFTSFPILPK